MKVIMKAIDIPKGSKVIKIKGEKKFTIYDSFTFYYPENTPKRKSNIEIGKGCRVLIDGSNAVNIIDGNTELVWLVDEQDLFDYLQDYLAET